MYQRILAPVDIQHRSSWATALPGAVHEAKAAPAIKLYVMTVVPDLFAGVDWRYTIRGETGGSEAYNQKDLIRQAKARLQEIVAEVVPGDVPVEVIVKHGTPYNVILDTAAELDVDLIVLAAHRPSLKDYLIGPTTARVVRHAECSVLVVRAAGPG